MTIEIVTTENLGEVLPLIEGYQRYYRVADIDPDRNADFFGQFARDHDRGVLHLYRKDGRAVGFVTLYFSFSSTQAAPLAILNDLYVEPGCRGQSIGRALILHAKEYAGRRGYRRVEWATAHDNETAQRLYDALPATRSAWLHYELKT